MHTKTKGHSGRPPASGLPDELVNAFIRSRRDGLSPETLKFYSGFLALAKSVVGITVTGKEVKQFLG